ncbi:MAG: hypothetical protein Q9222_004215 [Ikaeria aurantiellina]
MGRLELRERRVEMRQQHSLVRRLESRLLRFWQESGKRIAQDDGITDLHGELCAALDMLGPMEDAYDEKEDELDAIEYDMEAKETRFYEHHARVASDDSHGSPSSHHSSISSFSNDLHFREAYDEDFTSPQYQYYSRIGDVKIARERLLDLEAQRAHYLDIERERDALGVPLYQENIEFLSNYDSVYTEHLEEIEKIERDIQNLEVEAGFSSAKDESDSVLVYELEKAAEAGADQRAGSVADFGHARHWDPLGNDAPRRKSETDMWTIPDSTRSSRDRINQWILERLQDSPIEQARHRAILNDPKLGRIAWWNRVREFWQLDRAARSSNSSRHVSGASASTRPQDVYESTDRATIDLALDKTVVTDFPPKTQSTVGPSPRTDLTRLHDRPNTTNLGQTDGFLYRLDYLDLAIASLPPQKIQQGKWDSILGC